VTRLLLQAVVPAARSSAWGPLVVVAAALLPVSLLARGADRPLDTLVWIGAAAVASALVYALRDRCEQLLAALPTWRATRRGLRLVVLAPAALALWWLVTSLLPGDLRALGPATALLLSGLAVATWAPTDRAVALGAALPLGWVALDLLVGPDVLAGAAAWWRTEPLVVSVLAAVALVLGRHR
jgi:hypothetical protein